MPGPFRAVAATALSLLAVGCVERRMTIRSTPSNALVILDGQEIGFTPVSVPFTYYGAREVKLIKDGYETRVIRQRVAAPWYQTPGIDFVAEALVPVRIRDERDYGGEVYTLEPKQAVPQDQLVARANDVRAMAAEPPPRALQRAGVENFLTDPGAGRATPAALGLSAVPTGPAPRSEPAPLPPSAGAGTLLLPPAPENAAPLPIPAAEPVGPAPETAPAAPRERSIPAPPRTLAIPPAQPLAVPGR